MKNIRHLNTFFRPDGGEIDEPVIEVPDPGGSNPYMGPGLGEDGAFYPKSRREQFVSMMADNPGALNLTPVVRREYFYAKISGRELPMDVFPMIREENMLAQFVGDGNSSDQYDAGVIDGGIDIEAPNQWA